MPLNRIAHAARTALIACNLAVFAALAAPALVAAQDGLGQQAASVHRQVREVHAAAREPEG